jgi:hypothetical protein
VYSALCKGLNYEVAATVLSIEDILTRVGNAFKSLPAEMAEDAKQETVKIIRDPSRLRNNLTGAENVPRAVRTNTDHHPPGRQGQCNSGTQQC